ncbi:MAG: phosphatidate cytidylyltransferase [Planctomycetaceae bacterium]|nr:phosphatidate cytidylyltransferase [Planctomycetaceae bacterium]
MLRWRLLLGTVFIALLVALVWIDLNGVAGYARPGMALLPLALVLAVGGTQEFLSMVRTREPNIAACPIYFGNLAIVAAAGWADERHAGAWQLAALAAALLLVVLTEIFRYDKDVSKQVTERLGLSVLGLVYVGFLMSFIVRLRLVAGGATIVPLVSMLVVVKLADIGAYTVGRLIGRHKMAPKLSPGKTWEGLAGGVLFSLIGGTVVAWRTGLLVADEQFQPAVLTTWIAYAVVVGLTGTAGDLIESLLKRDFGRKDSSTWMPGFGGVLDLIDSPLLAAPAAWAFWTWWM